MARSEDAVEQQDDPAEREEEEAVAMADGSES
jgi:hypothetical protein